MDYKTLKPSINTRFEGFGQWRTTDLMQSTANTVVSKTVTRPIAMSFVAFSNAFIQGSRNPQIVHMSVNNALETQEIYRLHSTTSTSTESLGIKAWWLGY